MASFTAESADPFGEALRGTQFSHHSPTLIRLNNGSFGASPRVVLDKQRIFQDAWLSNPDDEWHALTKNFHRSRGAVAKRLFNGNVSEEDIFLVDSLTVGMSLIIHNVIACMDDPNSVVLVSNHTYNAVRLAINHGCQLAAKSSSDTSGTSSDIGPTIAVVDIPFPIITADHGNQVIITAYENVLEKLKDEGKTVKFAFLDHIVSLPSMLIPIAEVVRLCRSYNVEEIVVDGAHVPGQIPLDTLSSLGCDYYLANIHKWCFAPAGAAFLWVSPSAPSRGKLHHPVVSHSYNQGLFAETCMLGTKDYSAMFVIPEALDFIDSLGGFAAVQERNIALCGRAADMLSESWGTEDVKQPKALRAPYLCMVGLPKILGDSWEESEILRLQLRNLAGKGIVTQKFFPVKGDRMYLRISAAVYNSIEEFAALRDAINEIVAEKVSIGRL